MSKYARKRDANHAPIAEALSAVGVWVWATVEMGHGFPDMLVWTRRTGFVLLEIKTPGSAHAKAKATGKGRSSKTAARQAAFRSVCPGPVHVVSTVKEAFAALGIHAEAA